MQSVFFVLNFYIWCVFEYFRFSRGEPISYDWLCHQIGFSDVAVPNTILDLIHMEAVHDVFDLYLWLSYRFPDMFPDTEIVRSIQSELDDVIEEGEYWYTYPLQLKVGTYQSS